MYVFSEDGKVLKIIHNYGHGGAGVTLAWGCAAEVLAIVEQMYGNRIDSNGSAVAFDKIRNKDNGGMNFKSKLWKQYPARAIRPNAEINS